MGARRPWYSVLYVQVLIAIVIGIAIGHFFPKTGVAMKPLGDGFIQLIKIMIAPIIFCTVVHGIASMSDLTIGEVVHPGAGFNIDPASLNPDAVKSYVQSATQESVVAHLLAIIPN